MSFEAPPLRQLARTSYVVGIAAARFNLPLVDGLLESVTSILQGAGARQPLAAIIRVPGSHELPWAVNALARRRRIDCVIGLGVLIAGETNHHEMVGNSVSAAFQSIAIQTGIPVINGVIVANTLAQARARCLGKINRGAEFAHAALEMAALKRKLGR